MHDLFVIAIPTVAVMFGILLKRQDASSIRAEMVALRDSIHRGMIALHGRVAIVETQNNN
jgi:hypothetical protein